MSNPEDFEEESFEGIILAIHGPASNGEYKLEVQKSDNEVILITISMEQCLEMLREIGEAPNTIRKFLN